MIDIVKMQAESTEKGMTFLTKKHYKPLCRILRSNYWIIRADGNWCREVEPLRPFKNHKWIAQYVYGKYHCDTCPMCWSDWSSYLGDGDAGCYIHGDLRDSCRLLPPFRWLLGWGKKRKALYHESHMYDGCDEWFEQVVAQDIAMEKALLKALRSYELVWRDLDGNLLPGACKAEFVQNNVRDICREYEEEAHPVLTPTLKEEWKHVLKRTWDQIADRFRPYFGKIS